jgi:anion-transporting  ArsA/GET3 family ATPase
VRSLLERRLVIVTGKGGTGKTTVAACLAVAAHAAGRRVLVVEMGPGEHVPRLIAPGVGPVGYAGRDLAPGLRAMRIDPFEALAEYVGLQLGGRSVVEFALRGRAFRQLMEASPGWRELITLGKIWHLEQMQEGAGAPRFDLIVVDAPATGHGVTFLDVPRVVVSAVRAGPLRRHAGWVEQMVVDRERTLLLPVALAEEIPARETAELVARLRDQVGVAVDRVVVNGVAPAPFPERLGRLDERLARLDPDTRLDPGPPAGVLAACAAHLRARFELNRSYLAEVATRTDLPVVSLPLLPAGVEGPDDLRRLAGELVAEPRRIAA